MPSRIPMEAGDKCQWYLLNDEEEYAIQYIGPKPDLHLPVDMDGILCVYGPNLLDESLIKCLDELQGRLAGRTAHGDGEAQNQYYWYSFCSTSLILKFYVRNGFWC